MLGYLVFRTFRVPSFLQYSSFYFLQSFSFPFHFMKEQRGDESEALIS